MILTLIHYLFTLIALIGIIRLYYTDYKIQREQDIKIASDLEASKQTQIFDILIFIVLSLIF